MDFPSGNETVVINSGPLIVLAKIDALGIVGELPCRFLCPNAVRLELDSGSAKGYPEVRPPWLAVEPLASPISPMVDVAIDRGEAEVIQMALDRGLSWVCIDERKGRRMARVVGLRVTGALGLLVAARQSGLIPRLKPYTDRIQDGNAWYSPALIESVLQHVGTRAEIT